MQPAPEATDSDTAASRLTALADGVFAIAMTLLVLDLSVPPGLNDQEFREALHETLPKLLAYAISFAVIAEFWTDHRRILGSLRTVSGWVTGLTLLGLGLIALLPFPTALLAEYGNRALPVAIYSLSVAATNAVHLALLLAVHRRLPTPDSPLARKLRLLHAADFASTVVMFGLAIPLAFAFPNGAKWFWALLVPLKVWIGHWERRTARRLEV
ncbi:TMEM175 family protein [Streptomyces sp. NPDC051776]|uniref:TMEM175 family protein n=1 Tax=Streptomyces sp. NPDC051776 TaxID=3155414 RepID=UPI00341BCD2B